MNVMRVPAAIVIAHGFLIACLGCSSSAPTSRRPQARVETHAAPRASAENPHRRYPRVVILGDSLTAGYGLPQEQAYLSLLQRRLDAMGLKYEMVNGGV